MKQFLLVVLTMLVATVGANAQNVPPSTNRGVIVLKPTLLSVLDSASTNGTSNVTLVGQFIGGTYAQNVVGEVSKFTGNFPANTKLYLLAGNRINKLAIIDSATVVNASKNYAFPIVGERSSYSYYGLNLVVPSSTHTGSLKGTMQGKTPPEIKSN
ncbi:hypothetical protein [Runella sp.]|uniref:hypothetical protein n=1 Tax=Runella sp. TaxID=1960881 RepID=UPI003D0CAA65